MTSWRSVPHIGDYRDDGYVCYTSMDPKGKRYVFTWPAKARTIGYVRPNYRAQWNHSRQRWKDEGRTAPTGYPTALAAADALIATKKGPP